MWYSTNSKLNSAGHYRTNDERNGKRKPCRRKKHPNAPEYQRKLLINEFHSPDCLSVH